MLNAARQKYLVLTALEDYWDTNKPLVFLGDWCCRFGRRAAWDKPINEIISHPFKVKGEHARTFEYVSAVYEKFLVELAVKLNTIHSTSHNVRYWRIIIGPWLLCYIGAMYERYRLLKKVLIEHPGIITVLLPKDDRETPLDTRSFFSGLENDEYNLQLFSSLLSLMSPIDYQERPLGRKILAVENVGPKTNLSTLKKIVNRLERIVVANFPGREKQLFMYYPYINISPRRLFVKSGSRIRYRNENTPIEIFRPNIEKSKRERELVLSLMEFPNDEFINLIKNLLPLDLPASFYEGYSHLKKYAFRLFPNKVKAVLSAVSWYFMDHFKIWAAAMAEEGAYLIGNQHGGNYGCQKYFLYEDHELNIVDYYFSWGWEKADSQAKIVPVPAGKFISRINSIPKQKEGILLGTTGSPRYSRILKSFMPFHYLGYIDWQSRFVDNLPEYLQALLAIRLYQHDYGWDLIERWKEINPGIKLEGWAVPFEKRLSDCRLYVCDHLSTTFVQAIARNKPTILFWDPNIYKLRSDARSYYEELVRLEILHFSPESAARNQRIIINQEKKYDFLCLNDLARIVN